MPRQASRVVFSAGDRSSGERGGEVGKGRLFVGSSALGQKEHPPPSHGATAQVTLGKPQASSEPQPSHL